ncbi:MAG: GGDEF domain-containing protein [Deltaproteobacteria bacterium]|nr:GGDEF domain-containing protein [Deltaproteobacteria bacterium]
MDRRNLTELEKAVLELEFHVAVTTAILGTLDLDEILGVILASITSDEGLGFRRACVFLDDDAGRTLRARLALTCPDPAVASETRVAARAGPRGGYANLLARLKTPSHNPASEALTAQLANFALPLHRLDALAASPHVLILHSEAPLVTVMARCLVNRAPFCSNALTLRHEVGGAAGEILEFRRVAIVPLLAVDRVIGAIVADNARFGPPVESDDLRRLHAMGNLAALAIDRGRLHAQTVAMAEVDGLTGVYNRRHYQEELRRALRASGGGRQPMSIVVFDLDHFKRYNDEAGHLVGDELLKDVARLLTEGVRQSDVVARYGGEEFVVLLKDTSGEAAVQVAEKLRQRVKAAALAGGRVSGLTLSAGVATAQAEDTPDELFDRADRALYRAKQAGRDQTRREVPPEAPSRRAGT